ncbi:hypothetical protein B5M09_012059, partial [Aphanomyces astaci]
FKLNCFRGGEFSAVLNITLFVAGVSIQHMLLHAVFTPVKSATEIPMLMVGFGSSVVALFVQLGGASTPRPPTSESISSASNLPDLAKTPKCTRWSPSGAAKRTPLWDDDGIAALFRLRYKSQLSARFYSKSNADKKTAYVMLAAELSVVTEKEYSVAQVQDKLFVCTSPLVHGQLRDEGHLRFVSPGSPVPVEVVHEPCVVFANHPSLRVGDVVQLIPKLERNAANAIVFIDPLVSPFEDMTPFQRAVLMGVIHVHIDFRLSCNNANILIAECKPQTLVLPGCYASYELIVFVLANVFAQYYLGYYQYIALFVLKFDIFSTLSSPL